MSETAFASIPNSHPPNDDKVLAHVVEYQSARLDKSPIYKFLLSDAEIYYAAPGLIVARLTVTANHINAGGGLHGSVTATIVDWAGGLCIAAYDCRQKTGVSVEINVSYVSIVKVGDIIDIEGKAEKVGSNIAFTTVEIHQIVNDTRKKLVATGRHTKFVRP